MGAAPNEEWIELLGARYVLSATGRSPNWTKDHFLDLLPGSSDLDLRHRPRLWRHTSLLPAPLLRHERRCSVDPQKLESLQQLSVSALSVIARLCAAALSAAARIDRLSSTNDSPSPPVDRPWRLRQQCRPRLVLELRGRLGAKFRSALSGI